MLQNRSKTLEMMKNRSKLCAKFLIEGPLCVRGSSAGCGRAVRASRSLRVRRGEGLPGLAHVTLPVYSGIQAATPVNVVQIRVALPPAKRSA